MELHWSRLVRQRLNTFKILKNMNKNNNKMISMEDVRKHNNKESCWVVINGYVYDLTTFLNDHPGGSNQILNYAGGDGSIPFNQLHSADFLNSLDENSCLGKVDISEITDMDKRIEKKKLSSSLLVNNKNKEPNLYEMMNIHDFEDFARKKMSSDGWSYYSSGADDEITLRENITAFQRIWFRPRVMVNVKNVNMTSKMLGYSVNFPVYITATALGRLAHPEGEVVLTRAAYHEGIIQMCPTLASCTMDELTAARQPNQIQFYQLYVNSDPIKTEAIVRKAEKSGYKALCITVDAPVLGKREKDMRHKFVNSGASLQKNENDVNRNQGAARALTSFIDPSLCWNDLKWFRSITSMKIVLKGIQCGEDAIIAYKHGVDAIIISNHGGRQLDYARSGIEVLAEVIHDLNSIGWQREKMEVWVDGGFRRGTDIFKALAMGATAIGVGRPVLYGMASFGEDGVRRVLQLLKEELAMTMRLVGVTNINDINSNLITFKNLHDHTSVVPKNRLMNAVYEPLETASMQLSKL